MKSECTRRIRVPFCIDAMRREVTFYATWYNEYRPHTAFVGHTPFEVYRGQPPRTSVVPIWPRRLLHPQMDQRTTSRVQETLARSTINHEISPVAR